MSLHQSLTIHGIEFAVEQFTDLTGLDIKNIYQLRQQVFIIEQDCPYPDIDEDDLVAWHVFHRNQQGIDAYARVLTDDQGHYHIGRVVVNADMRQQGLGQALMKAAIMFCQKQDCKRKIIISAQSYLARFYGSLGFQATGDYYLEDNIPHMRMILPPA